MSGSVALDSKTQANNYSISELANDFANLTKSRDVKDMFEAVINACDWMVHLGINKKLAGETSAALEPVKLGFSIPNLFHHLSGLRDQVRVSETKDSDRLKRDVFNHTVLGVHSGTEVLMFLNSTGIYVIKEGMRSIKIVFWMALGIFDVVNLYSNVGKIKDLRAELDQTKFENFREILNSKINLTYLQIIQSITLIATASIALVSILFAAAAQGFLFNSVVMMGLTTGWLTLQFVNYFYDKIITHRENNLINGRVQAKGV